jgi:hypothetical protein
VIVDIALAPKNANGKVEYAFDFYILKPFDLSKGNHKVMYEPPNRGRKTHAALNRGAALVPTATLIGLLVKANPNNEIRSKDMQAGARTLGVEVDVLRASTERDIDEVFASLVQKRVGALVINSDPLFTGGIEQLVALTVRYAMPTIYNREFAAAGGLMSTLRTPIV